MKNSISVLALISIGFSLFILFELGAFSKKQIISDESSKGETETKLLLLREPSSGFSLAFPVEKKYFETAIFDDEENPQILSFFLEVGTPIRAVFDGKITKVLSNQESSADESSFEEILLEREDGIWAGYTFFGETSVKEGDVVKEGAILARAKGGEMKFLDGSNLSFRLHNEQGEFFKLSKEIFK